MTGIKKTIKKAIGRAARKVIKQSTKKVTKSVTGIRFTKGGRHPDKAAGQTDRIAGSSGPGPNKRKKVHPDKMDWRV